MSPEMWLPVVGFEGIYEVSDTGKVRSLDRMIQRTRGRAFFRKGILLRQQIRFGRHLVCLRKPPMGSSRVAFVHTLVLEAFVGPRPAGMQCCHYDDNPSNNNLANLRWDTDSANKFDSVRNGTHPKASRTHCKQGHEFNDQNSYSRPGRSGRICRVCNLNASRRFKQRARLERQKRAA
jgi:hypothetical protein